MISAPGWMTARVAMKGVWLAFIGAAILAPTTIAAVQTIRLEGLQVWPLSITGWIETAENRQDQIDRMIEANEAAAAKAKAARLAQESLYRDIAQRIDDDAQDNLDAALRAADRFIAAGGMRAQAAGNPRCGAGTGAEDRSAEDPAGAGRPAQLDAGVDRQTAGLAEGLVLVSAEDIRICTRNTIKAEAGHQLATRLQAASAGQGGNQTARTAGDSGRAGEGLDMPASPAGGNGTEQ